MDSMIAGGELQRWTMNLFMGQKLKKGSEMNTDMLKEHLILQRAIQVSSEYHISNWNVSDQKYLYTHGINSIVDIYSIASPESKYINFFFFYSWEWYNHGSLKQR